MPVKREHRTLEGSQPVAAINSQREDCLVTFVLAFTTRIRKEKKGVIEERVNDETPGMRVRVSDEADLLLRLSSQLNTIASRLRTKDTRSDQTA